MKLMAPVFLPLSLPLFLSLSPSLTHTSLYFRRSFCLSLFRSLHQSAGTNTGRSRDVTAHGERRLGAWRLVCILVHAPTTNTTSDALCRLSSAFTVPRRSWEISALDCELALSDLVFRVCCVCWGKVLRVYASCFNGYSQ